MRLRSCLNLSTALVPSGLALPAARACLAVAVLATGWLGPAGVSGVYAQTVVSRGGNGGGPHGGSGGTLNSDGSTTNASPGTGASGGGGGAPGYGQGAPGGSSGGGQGGYGGSNAADSTTFDGLTSYFGGYGYDGYSAPTSDSDFSYGGGGGGAGGAGAILTGTGSVTTQSMIRGGDGGYGGDAFVGYGYGVGFGGGGGDGGVGILVTGSAILTSNSGNVTGGYGGSGANGSNGGTSGSSGAGGTGIFIANGASFSNRTFTNTNAGSITGGTGGAAYVSEANAGTGGTGLVILGGEQFLNQGTVSGGDGGGAYSSDLGGTGGIGVHATGATGSPADVINDGGGTIYGGFGGYAVDYSSTPGTGGTGLLIDGGQVGNRFDNRGTVYGGGGGTAYGGANDGGFGVSAIGTSEAPVTVINERLGLIYGGSGGSPYGGTGAPGAGAAGISGSFARITNQGLIQGGDAGTLESREGDFRGFAIVAIPGDLPPEVQGGAGITGSNLIITNSGVIVGGSSNLGVQQTAVNGSSLNVINSGTIGGESTPTAIQFSGGINRLELQPGFAIDGNVLAFRASNGARNDSLVLGGDSGSGIFHLNELGLGQKYQNFSDTYQKIGTSLWTLDGTTTLSGLWQVSNGTLVVDGSATGMKFVVGNTAIDPVIGGGGTIGTLVVGTGGVVDPKVANPAAVLTVTGNATFGPNSVYRVRISPGGSSATQINVLGTTTISPANTAVDVVAAPGIYNTNERYTLLTAAGGLTPGSAFANLTTTANLAFLQPYLTYDPNNVYLGFKPNGVTFPSVANTPNQQAAAGGIQGLGPGNPLYNIVLTQTPGGARQAFDATSGEPHASVATAGVGGAAFISTAVFDRLWNMGGAGAGDAFQMLQNFGSTLPTVLRCYTANDATSTTNLSSYSAWGQAFGSFGHNGGNGNATAVDNTLAGFIAGVDVPVYGYLADVWRFGVAGGYTNDSLTVPNRSSNGTYESAFGTLYGGMRAGAVDLRFGASAGTDSTSLRRNVAFPGFLELERSNYGGTTVQGFAELGYRFAYGLNVVEPVAGFTAVHLHQDGFNEKGGVAALHGFGHDTDVETTTLGFRAEILPFVELPLVARMHLAWQHAYGDLSPTAVVAFRAGGAPFKVSGAPIDRDSALAEVGLEYRATSAMTIGLDYTGDVGPRDFANGVRGRLNYRF